MAKKSEIYRENEIVGTEIAIATPMPASLI